MHPDDYRESHLSKERALVYENVVYGRESHDSYLWGLERDYLRQVISTFPKNTKYLDFACGTGRILGSLAESFDQAVGVDISPEMLFLARRKEPNAQLFCADITQSNPFRPNSFDLITAFRFFTNSQETLRQQALAALGLVLAPDGVLILNIHGNLWSLRFPSIMVRRFVLRQKEVNALSLRAMRRKLRKYGLEVTEVRGFGILPSKVFRAVPARLNASIEAMTVTWPFLQRFAIDLVLVCTKSNRYV